MTRNPVTDWYKEMREKVNEENAIQLTIEKCRLAAAGKIPLRMSREENCPLCLAFPGVDAQKSACAPCPLYKKTKQACDMYNPMFSALHGFWLKDANENEIISSRSETAKYLRKEIIPLLKTLEGE